MKKDILTIRKFSYLGPWILVVLWMILIFNMSAEPATQSNKLSTGITEKVIETVEKTHLVTDLNKEKINHIIRKNAHFSIYLVLAILVLNAFRKSEKLVGKRLFLALGICVLYAISDEIHQLFVIGRGAQVKDVFIDSAGAAVGIGIYFAVQKKLKNGSNI
ncbi:VanZ family protein [Neobacillus sp. PS3-34]|uniref:VanZ family protein n=1 Tax=Neobacillus sp. PS3-34 TaxID=3070678 RepID=UPI0027E1B6AD|nr:VanZ family protein [Neobacillus sp. PS3-34]WML46685.1 VanZ family protein [Neobacillus sp. PS3-34]